MQRVCLSDPDTHKMERLIVYRKQTLFGILKANENSLRGSKYISPINTSVQPNTTLYDAIVIGGGWSGLSAAGIR